MDGYIIRQNNHTKLLECIRIPEAQYKKSIEYSNKRGKVTTCYVGQVHFILVTTGLKHRQILISAEDFDKIENKKNFEIFLAMG